jgi:hypothetical protein
MTKLSEAVEACPFCATAMHRHEHCFSHPYPAKGDCLLRHYSFDNRHIEQWNTRAAINTIGKE